MEENRFRSFMLLTVGPDGPLSAAGIQASTAPNAAGHVGRVFDRFDLR